MRDAGLACAVLVGFWCDSPGGAKILVLVGRTGDGDGHECFVCRAELWACARMDVAGFACDVGFDFWLRGGLGFSTAVGTHRMDFSVVGGLGAAKRTQPIARERIFRSNLANVGAGAICAFSWLGAMARLAMALRCDDAGAGALVARAQHTKLKSLHDTNLLLQTPHFFLPESA